MKHPERVEDCLGHIAEAIARATGTSRPLQDFEAFEKKLQVQDAVVRNIEIIGEAVNKINNLVPELLISTLSFHGRRCGRCATFSFTSIFSWN